MTIKENMRNPSRFFVGSYFKTSTNSKPYLCTAVKFNDSGEITSITLFNANREDDSEPQTLIYDGGVKLIKVELGVDN